MRRVVHQTNYIRISSGQKLKRIQWTCSKIISNMIHKAPLRNTMGSKIRMLALSVPPDPNKI